MNYRRAFVLTSLSVYLIACGPSAGDRDDGGTVDTGDAVDSGDDGLDSGDDALDSGDHAVDAGEACGVEEGTFECAGSGAPRMCCDGTWHRFADGPCYLRDAGGVDAGPADCDATPNEPGCPCADGAEDMCRAFRTTLRCIDGVWTERVNVSCCAF